MTRPILRAARWLLPALLALALAGQAAASTPAAMAPATGVPTHAADEGGPQAPQGGLPFYPQGCAYSSVSQPSSDVPKAIPDANLGNIVPGIVTSTLTVSGLGSSLWNVNVTLAISHSFNADLDVYLISPAGTRVTLTTDNGGSFNNGFNGTHFSDQAGNEFVPGPPVTLAVFTDTVALAKASPEQPLAALQGQNPNGVWKLVVKDDAHGDTGKLQSWSLDVRALNQTPVTKTYQTSFGFSGNLVDNGGAPTSYGVYLPQMAAISAITLTTAITHPASSQLRITLVTPEHLTITVASNVAGAGANAFRGTVWSDRAGNNTVGPVTDFSFAGSAASLPPQEPFAVAKGTSTLGLWLLQIQDTVAGQSGSVGPASFEIAAQTCRPQLGLGAAPYAGYGRLGSVVPVDVYVANQGAPASSAVVTTGVSSDYLVTGFAAGAWSCSQPLAWALRCAHGPLATNGQDIFTLSLHLPDVPHKLPLQADISAIPEDSFQNDTVVMTAIGAFAHSANGNPWDVSDQFVDSLGPQDSGSIVDGGQAAFNDWGQLMVRVLDENGALVTQSGWLENLGLAYAPGGHWVSTHITDTAGVLTARSLWAPPGADWLRYVDTFTNTNPAPRTLVVAWGGYVGSYVQTRTAATSDADPVLESTDTWAVTGAQASPGSASVTPPVGFVFRSGGDNSYLGPYHIDSVGPSRAQCGARRAIPA